LLRCLAGPIVWLTIIFFFTGLITIDILLAGKAGMSDIAGTKAPEGQGTQAQPAGEIEKEYETYYRYLFWIFIGLTAVFCLVLLFLFHRIQLAIALIKESADVMKAMPHLIMTPITPTIAVGMFGMYGIFIAAMLASSGTIEEGELKWDKTLRYYILYHFFFCVWVLFFIAAIQTIAMAGAVASYYWTRDKDKLTSPISKAFYRTFRYSLGSAVFGSLVLALVKTIKWVLTYMSQKIKKYAGTDNQAIKFLLCCFNCCLWCFEKFIKFLTKNSYIMIAVDGSSFCKAAEQSWTLIMANVLRMTTVNIVTKYVFFLSKVAVGFICGVTCTVWLENAWVYQSDDLVVSSPFAPSIATFVIGYFVAYLFFEVTEFAIDTLLFCFCLDDMRNSQTGNYYASDRLLRFMATAPKMTHHDQPF